jgi:hypothetical protein
LRYFINLQIAGTTSHIINHVMKLLNNAPASIPIPIFPDEFASPSTASSAASPFLINDEMGTNKALPPMRNTSGVGTALTDGDEVIVGLCVGDDVGGNDGAPDTEGEAEGCADGKSVGEAEGLFELR